MGSIGGAELVLVLLLALLLFGPRRLPQIGRTLGRALTDLRRATTDFKTNLEREVNLEDVTGLHGEYKSARSEVSEAVKEFRNLGIPRDLGLEGKPGMPAAAPAPTPPPAKAETETESETETTRSPAKHAVPADPPTSEEPAEPADDAGNEKHD